MNKIIKKFLLTREKIMSKFRETGNLKHMYRKELDKVCFAHDAAYSDSKDLAKRTSSDKNLKERALASIVYNFFDKKTG